MTEHDPFVVMTTPWINSGAVSIILADFNFWNLHMEELKEWCKEHNCLRRGLIIDFPHEEQFVLFKLTWG